MIPTSSSIGERDRLPPSSRVVAGPSAKEQTCLRPTAFRLRRKVLIGELQEINVNFNRDFNQDHPSNSKLPGQVVLVFQGGGALGSYQAGVYQALHEASIEPDWIIGTSIGAINAGLIAGNRREDRMAKLEEFWKRVESRSIWDFGGASAGFSHAFANWSIFVGGIPGFFEPNLQAHWGTDVPIGSDRAGYYSTMPLEKTLSELVDFQRINRDGPRFTVGAAHVRTSEMRYFDSRGSEISVRHILASGALPPAFPAVRIDGELYWDGGVLSNTPTEIVFDDNPRKDSLIFAVHMWNPAGSEPETMGEVLHRHKDIQYSSRIASHVTRQKQTHRMRHVISQLAATLTEDERNSDAVKELASYGCTTRMHVVQLLAPRLNHENYTKDIDFSQSGIRHRWEAGFEHTKHMLEKQPWEGEFDPLEGVILHQRTMD
jgi:NTE family protein